MNLFATLIHQIIQLLILIVIIDAVLSFVMSPYHPVRVFIGRIVNPLLSPIRRVMPATGPVDFSPFVLVVILYILDTLLTRILYTL